MARRGFVSMSKLANKLGVNTGSVQWYLKRIAKPPMESTAKGVPEERVQEVLDHFGYVEPDASIPIEDGQSAPNIVQAEIVTDLEEISLAITKTDLRFRKFAASIEASEQKRDFLEDAIVLTEDNTMQAAQLLGAAIGANVGNNLQLYALNLEAAAKRSMAEGMGLVEKDGADLCQEQPM